MARPRFTEADVRRAAKGALSAGLTVVRVEIGQDGKLIVVTSSEAEDPADAALESWSREHGKR